MIRRHPITVLGVAIRSPRRALATLVVGSTIAVAFGVLVGWNWLGIVGIGMEIAWSLSPLNQPSTRV